MRVLPRLSVVVLCLTLLSEAHAWAERGHRSVADLAERQLRPETRAAVAELLAGEPEPTLAGVAYWADALRGTDPERFRATSAWHYVNSSPGTCAIDMMRDCPNGACVVGAIEAQARVLADATRPLSERRDALKFVVHLVGDAHQPFHASDRDDLGGNRVALTLRTQIEPEAYARAQYVNGVMQTNLHSVWDYYIVADTDLSTAAYADRLAATGWPTSPSTMSPPIAWAGESCRLIEQRSLYPPSGELDPAYLETFRPLAEQRIRQAAYRLAFLLNHALGQ